MRRLAAFILLAFFAVAASPDSASVISPDTSFRDTAVTREVPRYVQRHYDHRQQVIVGSVVMLCVALTLAAMNNYNPRR